MARKIIESTTTTTSFTPPPWKREPLPPVGFPAVCVCVPRRANRRLDGAGREWETLEREREDWRDDPPLVFEKEWTGGEGLPSSRSKGTLVPTAIHALADQANAHHRPRVACPSLSLFVFFVGIMVMAWGCETTPKGVGWLRAKKRRRKPQ